MQTTGKQLARIVWGSNNDAGEMLPCVDAR